MRLSRKSSTFECACSVTKLCLTLCNPMIRSTPGLPVQHQLPEPTQTHIHCVGDVIQPSHPLPSCLFSNESAVHIRWPKYWSFSFSISPSSEHPGLSPLGWTGWISLLSKGLSRVFSNTTVQKHQFFVAQLSLESNSHIHPYMTTGRTIALTSRIFVGKVTSLLFNMLSRLVITFLPRSKRLLISWLQ